MTIAGKYKNDRFGRLSKLYNASRDVGLSLLLTAFVLTGNAHAQQSANSENAKNEVGTEDASYESIVIDLSLVQKIIADEAFIRGEACKVPQVELKRGESLAKLRSVEVICNEARAELTKKPADRKGSLSAECVQTKIAYCKAYDTLEKINPDDVRLPVSKRNTHELLRKDVAYRMFLLDQGVPFWGGARSLVPTIPIRHIRVMKNLLVDFEKQILEMLAFTESIKGDKDKIERLKAYSEEVRGRFRAEKINETAAVIRRRDSDVSLTTLEARFDHLERQRATINSEAEALRKEADKIASGAEKLIADAVMSSVGVPPGVVKAAESGDLEEGIKQAVLDTVSKDLTDGSGTIGKLAKDMGKSPQEFVALYQQGKELHDKFQEGRKTLEHAKGLLRKPSLDRLLNLGYHISDQLGPEDRNNLVAELDKVAPVASLYDAIRTVRSKPPSEACKALLDNPLIADQLNYHDSSACGLIDVTLPQSCEPSTITQFENACSKVSGGAEQCGSLRRGCKVKNQLTTEVNRLSKEFDDISTLVDEALVAVIDQAGDELIEIYANLLNEIAKVELSDDVLVSVLDETATVWSKDIIVFLVDKAGGNRGATLEALAKALKYDLAGDEAADIHQMAKRLAEHGLSRLKVGTVGGGAAVLFRLSDGKLQINNPANRNKPFVDDIQVSELLGLPNVESAKRALREGVLGDLKANIRSSMKKLIRDKDQIRQRMTHLLKPGSVETVIEKGLAMERNPPDADGIWYSSPVVERNRKALWKRMTNNAETDDSAKAVQDYGVGLLVGGMAATDLRDTVSTETNKFVPPPAQPVANAGGAPSLNDALTEQALTLALDAALPGAGVAFKVAQSLVALDVNIKRQTRLAADSVRLAMKMIDAQDEADNELVRLVLAQKDEELAKVLQQAAENQLQIYDFGIEEAAADAALSRARIKIRRALTFYVAERLREEFDLFNRSMGLWAGEANEPSRYAIRQIKSDPRNLRLALDPEIHLFDWLEREGEATRTDVDSLMVHWRQLVRLSIDLCQVRGCTPGGGRLGQTAQTGLLLLSDIVSGSEFIRFKHWQQDPGDHPFETEFLVHPDIPGFPPSYLNLRYVEMRLGLIGADGTYTVPHGVVVEHPGMGVVASRSQTGVPEFRRELLLKRRTSTFNLPYPFSLEDLRNRWENNNDREPSVFEGYGLFSRLLVTIHPTRDSLNAADLGIRIAYSYTDPEHVVTEQDFVKSIQSKASYNGFYEVQVDNEADKKGQEFIVDPYYDALCIRSKMVPQPYECTESHEPKIPVMSQFITGKLSTVNPGKADRFFSRKCARPIVELEKLLAIQITQERLDEMRAAAKNDNDFVLDIDALNDQVADDVTAEIARIRKSFETNKEWLKTCPKWEKDA